MDAGAGAILAWPAKPTHFAKIRSCEMGLVPLPFTAITTGTKMR